MSKTVKQIADEIQVSKQAIWQRIKRNEKLSTMIENHSETVNGRIYVDEFLEQHIKKLYIDRQHVDGDVDGNISCVDGNVDEASTCVDRNISCVDGNVDEASTCVDRNISCVDENVDEASTCVDRNISCVDENVDEASTRVDRNISCVDENVDEASTCVDRNVSCVDGNVDEVSTRVDRNISCVDENVDEASTCVDRNVSCVDGNVDEASTCVDRNVSCVDENVDEASTHVDRNLDHVDVNTLIDTLQSTVDILQKQLSIKDNQITELTAMLKASQDQQATLVTALSAAQALHAGTIRERLTDRFESSENQEDDSIIKASYEDKEKNKKQKNFFSRIFGKN